MRGGLSCLHKIRGPFWLAWKLALATVTLSFALAMPAIAWAQAAASVVHGVVVDATVGALPGVTVTLSSPALQVTQQVVVTGSDDSYRFVELPAGVYKATCELTGFSTLIPDELRLTIGFTARVDATLVSSARSRKPSRSAGLLLSSI